MRPIVERGQKPVLSRAPNWIALTQRRRAAILVFSSAFMLVTVETRAIELNGVMHSVEASIGAEPRIASKGTLNVTLTVNVRISAHSRSADFAGEIPVQFENVGLNKATPFEPIWTQDRCHERRGLPRIWVLRLSGSIMEGEKQIPVLAVPRQLGRLLPADELKTEQQVITSDDNAGSERIITTRSLASGLIFRLKLTTKPCAL